MKCQRKGVEKATLCFKRFLILKAAACSSFRSTFRFIFHDHFYWFHLLYGKFHPNGPFMIASPLVDVFGVLSMENQCVVRGLLHQGLMEHTRSSSRCPWGHVLSLPVTGSITMEISCKDKSVSECSSRRTQLPDFEEEETEGDGPVRKLRGSILV